MRKKKVLFLAVVLFTFALTAIYFLFIRGQNALQSVNASVDGKLLEVKTASSGLVKFVASEGQKIFKNNPLLEIDSSRQEQERHEVENSIQKQLAALPPVVIKILQGYALITETQEELGAKIRQNFKEFEQITDKITSLSISNAAFQVQMHKLELKKNRIAEDDEKLAGMRTAYDLMAIAMFKVKEERDEISNARADLEARLRTRKLLDQSVNGLSEEHKRSFELVKAEFLKLARAEQEITLSKLTAQEDVVVVKSFLQQGTQTEPGNSALLLAPENKEIFWVNAFFSAKDASKILPGMKCRTVLQTEEKLSIPGRVAESFYPEPQEDQNSMPPVRFRIILYAQDVATLAKLHDQKKAIVYIGE
jgi:multidrug resistance efflux pump